MDQVGQVVGKLLLHGHFVGQPHAVKHCLPQPLVLEIREGSLSKEDCERLDRAVSYLLVCKTGLRMPDRAFFHPPLFPYLDGRACGQT